MQERNRAAAPPSSGPAADAVEVVVAQQHAVRLLGVPYRPLVETPDATPRLFVVVDTEAEFDWSEPFARDLVGVDAIAALPRGQEVFEEFGIRPIYMVDFPVATKPDSYRVLRDLHDGGRCEIGAHLHPWTTPPFSETLSRFHSYPGNLPPDQEEAKLVTLLAAIEANFGVAAQFYKAGRYGLGPHTIPLIGDHGVLVDFSILANSDLRYLDGPDFRTIRPLPYLAGGKPILSVPTTRGHIGPLAPFAQTWNVAMQSGLARSVHATGALSRLGLVSWVSLTPEGFSVRQQTALMNSLVRQGYRTLVLSFHSPSLMPGHTPYVRTREDAETFVVRLRRVCQHFFAKLGGRAGHPSELIATARAASAQSKAR